MSEKREPSERKDRNLGRDQEILQHRAAGKSLQDIGRIYGISRERVRQILRRFEEADRASAGP
jgi:DNA-directed RNA polymerase sigma subunit (sigma70/sigma32)